MICIEAAMNGGQKHQAHCVIMVDWNAGDVFVIFLEEDSMSLSEANQQERHFLETHNPDVLEKTWKYRPALQWFTWWGQLKFDRIYREVPS